MKQWSYAKIHHAISFGALRIKVDALAVPATPIPAPFIAKNQPPSTAKTTPLARSCFD